MTQPHGRSHKPLGKQAKEVRRKPTAGWYVDLLPNATADALRLFERLPSAASAHAVTSDRIRSLELFSRSRMPNHGHVLDMVYEKIPEETFYRLKISDDCYAGRGDLCVLFSAFPAAPQDGNTDHAGTILIIGFCWWTEDLPEISIERSRHRHDQYVKRRR